ncbi:MAG: arylamine N-acetyltransferase [Asticcacaulis sp.]|nr:arylamine N-acetyltransferase [Asticcacaulis sp.]
MIKAAAFSLDSYLKRIGFAGEPRADVATLTQMMQQQARTVPFENLDVQAGKLVSIEPDDIASKILGSNRGGYCYEANGLLAMALAAVGIPYRILGARPIVPGPRKARSHMILLAFPNDGGWIADAGYGRFGLRQPIRLDAVEPVQQDFDSYRIVRDGEVFTIETQLGGDEPGWNPLYSFNLSPFELADFIATNYYNSTHPDAIFVQKRLLVRHTETGRHILFGNALKTYEMGVLRERELTAAELPATVKALFDLDI